MTLKQLSRRHTKHLKLQLSEILYINNKTFFCFSYLVTKDVAIIMEEC